MSLNIINVTTSKFRNISYHIYALSHLLITCPRTKMTKLTYKKSRTLIYELMPNLIENIPKTDLLNHQEMANLIYSLSHFKCTHPDLIKVISNYCEDCDNLRNFDTKSFPLFLYGIAKIGIQDYYTLKKPIERLVDEELFKKLSSRSLINVLYAIVYTKYKGKGEIEIILNEIFKWSRLIEYDAIGLSSLIHSLESLNYKLVL